MSRQNPFKRYRRVAIIEKVELERLHIHTPIAQNELVNIRHAESGLQLDHDDMITIENDDDAYVAWLKV